MEGIETHLGECLEVMAKMPAASVDSIVSDPPYGLEFMGKRWDYDVPAVGIWAECLRVLKPGGHLLAFAGTRTQHRMACNIEDGGFEIRDLIAWVYGSGFPKSLDVSKAIDRRRDDRAEILLVTEWIKAARDAEGISNTDIDEAFGFNGMAGHWTSSTSQPSVPTLEQVPKLLAALGDPQVPDTIRTLIWTLNGNKGQPGEAWFRREVLGTRAVPIGHAFAGATYGGDSSSTETNDTAPATEAAQTWEGWGTALKPALEPITVARKPFLGTVAANVLEHGTGAINVDGCRVDDERWPSNFIHDGSAEACDPLGESARFFYCAKAGGDERGEENLHPTVKPVDLMRYLVRMVTPPEGVVLDPFMGSGTTGVACYEERRRFIGIEREAEYIEIAHARIKAATRQMLLPI